MHNPKLPNIRMVLLPTVCLNTALNCELFVYMHACERCLSMELSVMKIIEVDFIVV